MSDRRSAWAPAPRCWPAPSPGWSPTPCARRSAARSSSSRSRTHGDVSAEPLASIGGTGVFVSALRDALLRGEVDVAVHSLKDLPTAPHPDVTLAAVPQREDPRDVRHRPRRPHPRRAAGRCAHRHRLARAGPRSCTRSVSVSTWSRFVATWTPGSARSARRGGRRRPGAGRHRPARAARRGDRGARPAADAPRPRAGCVGGRVPQPTDTELVAQVRDALDDPRTRAAVVAERAVLATLEAGCSAPVGAMAEIAEGDDGEELWLRAVALSGDGQVAVRRSASGSPGEAEKVGRDAGRGDVGRRGVGPDRGAGVMTEQGPARARTANHQEPEGDCEHQEHEDHRKSTGGSRPPAVDRPEDLRCPQESHGEGDRRGDACPRRCRSGSSRSWAAAPGTPSC